MIPKLLGLEEKGQITYAEWYLRNPWPAIVLLLLIIGAVVYAGYLYRQEDSITRLRRMFLGGVRGVIYAIILILLFEPVFALEMDIKLRSRILILMDVSESMNIEDKRTRPEDLKSAALMMGDASFGENPAKIQAAPEKPKTSTPSRITLAKSLLKHPELDIFGKLAETYELCYFGFGEHLEPAQGKGEATDNTLLEAEGVAKSTRMGSAIDEAVTRQGGQPIAGVILLTDGASNAGLEPLEVARRIGERKVPCYPIGLGLTDPLDVQIQRVFVQDTVFEKDHVPVRVQVSATGFSDQDAEIQINLGGEGVARKTIKLNKEPQFHELSFVPEKQSGTVKLEVSIDTFPGEISETNNRVEKRIRIIDDKIKVLYVEGMPRWEYRYLRQVLKRDHRLETSFLMTLGDRELAWYSKEHLARFPEDAAEAFKFDLVILGDVPAAYFSPAQMEAMEKQVRQSGGALLMIAGRYHAPASYANTPVAAMLPVKFKPEPWRKTDPSVHPVVTPEGFRGGSVVLAGSREQTDSFWSLVRPLNGVPELTGPKPGATVLAKLSSDRSDTPYPLIAWQRYGSGKTMFMGSDGLWRLRFKRGDTLHARLWGQVIQFLTLSRLLGENKRIRLETNKTSYQTAERVRIYANVLNEGYEPVQTDAYVITAEGENGEISDTIRLEPVPGTPGLYQGFYAPPKAGQFTLKTQSSDIVFANSPVFQVTFRPLEDLEPAMQEHQLRKIASLSGGKYITAEDLPKIQELIKAEENTTFIRKEKELWDLPIIFVILLTFLGLEWFLRRRYDLI